MDVKKTEIEVKKTPTKKMEIEAETPRRSCRIPARTPIKRYEE